MFTATESMTLLRLLAAVNTILDTPSDETIDDEVRVELEHARTASAALFADYVDTTAEKLDKQKDAMHKAWERFQPERRKSYGPIFEAAGVRSEAEQEETEAKAAAETAESEIVDAEILAVDGVKVAGLLSGEVQAEADPELTHEVDADGEVRPIVHFEEDDRGNTYEVDEPYERFDPTPVTPRPADQAAAEEEPVAEEQPEDELGKRRRRKSAKKAESAEGTVA